MTNIKQSTSTSKRTKKSYKLKKPNLSFDDPRVKWGIVGIIGVILSLIFMGGFFTFLLIFGVAFILLASKLVNKLTKNGKRKKVLNIIVIIFLSLCIFAVVCILLFFAYVVKTAPEFDTKKLVHSESTLVYDSKN